MYDHLLLLKRESKTPHFFVHFGKAHKVDFDDYDCIVFHYCLRLVNGMVPSVLKAKLAAWPGKKVLFVQDEYDLTETLRTEISEIGFQIVFTCVPEEHVERIYPRERFPDVRFVTTMTGFAPEVSEVPTWTPVEERPIWVGYRGRALPFRYGDLGQEKKRIAEQMRSVCEDHDIPCDIEWDDKKRIYGDAWPAFLGRCRVTLGTESGSNVFDDHGKIRDDFFEYLQQHPSAPYAEARHAVLGDAPEEEIMNQISPRVFEAISAGSALILYEGGYSRVLEPDLHYIPLCKNGSNIAEVVKKIHDTDRLNAMIRNAWQDILASGKFGEAAFAAQYDDTLGLVQNSAYGRMPKAPAHDMPIKTIATRIPPALAPIWDRIPISAKTKIKQWLS